MCNDRGRFIIILPRLIYHHIASSLHSVVSLCGCGIGNLVIRQEAMRSYTTSYKKAPMGVIFILNKVGYDVRKRCQGIYPIIPKSHVITFPSPRKPQPWN